MTSITSNLSAPSISESDSASRACRWAILEAREAMADALAALVLIDDEDAAHSVQLDNCREAVAEAVKRMATAKYHNDRAMEARAGGR